MSDEKTKPEETPAWDKPDKRNVRFPEDKGSPPQQLQSSNSDKSGQAIEHQTENMEVHHHGHVHHQRKWKEYIFQFFMLFLAVFCGFLAEYQLEHKIERNREYQYMQGFIDDLAADTMELNLKINFANHLSNGLDSLRDNLYDTDNALKNTQTLYRQSATYIRIMLVYFSDHTATQLRNSGTFRLIRNKATARAISEYWTGINHIQTLIGIVERRANEIFTVGNHIFNTKYLIARVQDSLTLMAQAIIDPAARLMTTEANALIRYANFVYRFDWAFDRFLIPDLKRQKAWADNLLDLIKKEYHLE